MAEAPARSVPPPRWTVAKRYLKLGFTHFVPEGPDPILFVLGLFLMPETRHMSIWKPVQEAKPATA